MLHNGDGMPNRSIHAKPRRPALGNLHHEHASCNVAILKSFALEGHFQLVEPQELQR
jgi:hypothetical protein